MRKAEKLFQLTNLIRVKQPITAERLAESLNVSVRTVYRYIDDLSVSGIPVYGTTGQGYRLDDHYELPPLNLNEKELEALLLGVQMVTSWTSDALGESARSLASKIESVIPQKILANQLKTIYAPDFSSSDKYKKVWGDVYNAIKSESELNIQYMSLDEKLTTRVIYPLGLFYWGGKWTIGSWCVLRQAYRDFRLDRVESLQTQKTYNKTEVINLDAYLNSCEE